MKLNLWNILSVFTLAITAGIGVLYLQIFVNPYAAINPFPPPTLPAALILPSATPTFRQLPPTWTVSPQSGKKNNPVLLPSSTSLTTNTPVNLPTYTPTFTETPTPTATRTRTRTPAYTRTSTDDPGDANTPTRTHTPKPRATKTQTRTPSATSLPSNPSIATETAHNLKNDTCQKSFSDPAFSWSPVSGATGYYVSWGTDSGGTSSNQQAGTTFTPSSVSDDGKYYLRVRTIFGTLERSDWSTIFTFCYDTTPPINPTSIKASVSDSTWTNESNLTFTWSGASDAVSGVRDYFVVFNTSGTGGTPGNAQTYASISHQFLTSGKYYLLIKTQDNVYNQADWKNMFYYWYDGTKPSTPGNIKGSSTDTKLSFSWDKSTDSASGVDHYELYFGMDENSDSSNQDSTSGLSFTSSDLTDAGTYFMKVRAVDGVGNKSDWGSGFTTFTPPATP